MTFVERHAKPVHALSERAREAINAKLKQVQVLQDKRVPLSDYLAALDSNQRNAIERTLKNLVRDRNYETGDKPSETKEALTALFEQAMGDNSLITSRLQVRYAVERIDHAIRQAIAQERSGQRSASR